MAIDSEDKRRSALSVFPGVRIMPVADGSIVQADWQHTAKVYRGIAAGAAAPSVLGPYWVITQGQFVAGAVKHDSFVAGASIHDSYVAGVKKAEAN